MKCYKDYCIYNKEFTCTTDELPLINELGMCDSCEIVAVPEETVNFYKNKRREEIDRIWKEYDERESKNKK